MSEQAKKARCSLKGGSLHTGGAKTIGTISREMIAVMSAQIAQLTSTLAELERRRVAEQQNMCDHSTNQRTNVEPRSSTYYIFSCRGH
ncbi:hypothetical protein MTR67_022168 [Solanum verrucosum]|uniref:Uncharacterized protein n=1 Tax=Solanum verrucosum TaxID=315347 RepID=A0AAF0QSX7_SOLVR|nr:hypothetical protein MTR67_022168 [Solanum verrucosum]